MPTLILGLVGKQGCGKGTVADLLRAEYGAGYYRFSAILGDILDRLAIEKNRDNFVTISTVLRQAFGEDVLSYALESHVVRSSEELVIIDGIRRPEDIVALEPLPQFHLISVDADSELRFERMKKRGEKVNESDMTWEKFLADEQASTEVTIPLVMQRAKVTLQNNGTREELIEKTRKMMKEFGFTDHATRLTSN